MAREALASHEPTALAEAPGNILDVIERMAANANVDVAKLEKIIELQERILRYQAEQAFSRDFIELQAALPIITERGEGNNEKSYATLEDIVEAVRPILHAHGFSLAHTTSWTDDGKARVQAVLTHRDGHARTSEFVTAPDISGGKNAIQAHGSAMSYGRRYTTLDVLGIVTRGEDADGRTEAKPAPPKGYQQWIDDLETAADCGDDALREAWKQSDPVFREYRFKWEAPAHTKLKTRAKKGGKA
jgi:hypothetical protein